MGLPERDLSRRAFLKASAGAAALSMIPTASHERLIKAPFRRVSKPSPRKS
jgi:hypothetical protein